MVAGEEGLRGAPGTGIVLIGAVLLAAPLVLGLAATTAAGAPGSVIVVVNAGLGDDATGALVLAEGAASTIRIGSSPEPVAPVENVELAVVGWETIGEDAAGVLAGAAEMGVEGISLRITAVPGLKLPSGNVTMGGVTIDAVLGSVGVAAGG